MNLTQFIHYFSVGLCAIVPSIAVAFGQAKTAMASFDATNTQPLAQGEISKTTIIALAFIETAGLFGVITSIILLYHKTINFYDALSQFGVVFAICLTGLITSIASSIPAKETVLSIARQPFIARKISNLMILCQSLIQTPLAFGFIITLLIYYQLSSVDTLSHALILISTGLCIGLASIGPAIGGAIFTQNACKAAGLNETAYGKIVSFTIISQAVIETPIIFAVIISFWLLSLTLSITSTWAFMTFPIAFVMGIGTLAAGIGSGRTAAAAVIQIPFIDDKLYNTLSKITIIAQGLIDTSAIYALIVAIVLIVELLYLSA